jgi:signal transduction histidine kinase
MSDYNLSKSIEQSKSPAAIAREIRDPLSKINLAAETLKAQIQDDEQKKFLDIILRGSSEIDLTVKELLLFQVEEVVRKM